MRTLERATLHIRQARLTSGGFLATLHVVSLLKSSFMVAERERGLVPVTQLYPRNITSIPGRVFLDISASGCSSGCSYCYISGPTRPQVLLSHQELDASITQLDELRIVDVGPKGTLISLCPNTEPFKTPLSTELLLRVLHRILPWKNAVQISTKEVIPPAVLEEIDSLAAFPGQVVLFTSCSTISRASVIEPGAAPPSERFRNFGTAKALGARKVVSCLYVKPFLPVTQRDQSAFIEVLQTLRPDAACVGILYQKTDKPAVTALRHPAHPELGSGGIKVQMKEFGTALSQSVGLPVFYTSPCVSAWARNWYPTPRVWYDFPELCVGCRDCEGEYAGDVGPVLARKG